MSVLASPKVAVWLPAVVLAVAGFAAGPAPADDWPVFRGNARQSGVAAGGLPERLVLRWTFKARDSIESGAAVVRDTAYVASLDGHLYALDLTSGKPRWQYRAPGFKAPPAVSGGAVHIGDTDGVFHCVDAATGKPRWRFESEGQIVGGANFAGNNILFGSYDAETLHCLSRDGKPRWVLRVKGPINGAPAVAGDRVLVAGCDRLLHVLDLGSGRELAAVNLDGQTGATPAVAGDHAFVGTMAHQVVAVDWKQGRVAWRFEAARRQQPFYASAAVTDALVLAGSRDQGVYALDRQTGKEVWKFATRGRVDSSPVVAGRRAYAASLDGNLYVLDLAHGGELARLAVGPTLASPAVGGGCLVIGNVRGEVYCFGAAP